MIPTFLMSWFIVNTAATAAMLPLLEAVLDQLDPDSQQFNLAKEFVEKHIMKEIETPGSEIRSESKIANAKKSSTSWVCIMSVE